MDHAGLTIVHLPLPPTRIVSPKDFPRASEAAPQVKVLAGEEKRRDSRATEDMAWRHRC